MRRFLISLLILVLCFSFAYAAIESVHDCHGEGECPICRIVAVITSIFVVTAVSFVSVLCYMLIRTVIDSIIERQGVPDTLIDLCVKLTA